MGWLLFIVFALFIVFYWIGKIEQEKEQKKLKNKKPSKKKKNSYVPSKPIKQGKPTTSFYTGPKKRESGQTFKNAQELIQKIKKEFQVKSPKTSMIYFKTTIDSYTYADIRENIKEDKEVFGKDFILDSEYYNRVVQNIKYDVEVEIETVAEFLNNPNFKKHDSLSEYFGHGYEIESLYEDIAVQSNSDVDVVFEEGVYAVLVKNQLADVRTPNSDEVKIYLDGYRVDDIKEILGKNGLKKSGKKLELIDRVVENNLIKIPNVVICNKEKIELLVKDIVKVYCDELLKQIKTFNQELQKIIKEESLIENDIYKTYIKEELSLS